MNIRGSSTSNRMPPIRYVEPAEAFPLSKGETYRRKPIASNIATNVVPLRSRLALGPSENLILRSLSAATRQAFEPFLTPVTLTKQQLLYSEEDRLDFVYFPGTAIVSEFRMLEDGRNVEVAVTGRDGAIGLSSLLLGSNVVGNTTQVSQPGTAEKMPVWALNTILSSNENVRASLNPFADRYVRQISQKVICNMYHPAKERLCTWLLMAQDRCRSETVNITHEQMARILGVFRPTVTFIAQQLRENDLIDYTRGVISICDRKRLRQSACACYLAPEWAL